MYRLGIVPEARTFAGPLILLIVSAAVPGSGCGSEPPARVNPTATTRSHPTNSLTDAERSAGWRLLFDGETLNGWRGLGEAVAPAGHWVVEDGTIRKVESGDVPTQADGQPLEGGDLMTTETFRDFELSWEWKVSEAGNSGVKYNVSEELSTSQSPPRAALGYEYQILDDDAHPDGEVSTHRTAALYDILAPGPQKQLRPVGEFNTSRIVFDGSHGEHWLNGVRVLAFDIDSAGFDSLLAASKYAPVNGFSDRRNGHIVLQDHGDDVWFRNIKIRNLSKD